jgi:hypothetical protein
MFCVALSLLSCEGAGVDYKRVKQLQAMPVLWESEVLVANPNIPELKTLIVMGDKYDPSLIEAMTENKKTSDYIPESVRAFSIAQYDNKPRTITVSIGDTVEILAQGKNNSGLPVYLFKTKQNTYGWLYGYHIQDKDGERVMSLK